MVNEEPGGRYTHLDSKFELSKELNLMFRDQLCKSDQEPSLKSTHPM